MSIGQTLAAAREQAGLSIDRVSEATRIRQTIIEAIERDDFSLCGGDFYARGHVRSIAQVVGVDSAPLMVEYDEAHDDTGARSLEALQSETYTARRRGGPNWSAAMAVVLVLVLGYGVFRIAAGGDDGSGGPAVAEPTQSAPATPQPTRTPTPKAEETEASGPVAVAPEQEVSVQLDVVGGDSWVSVRDPAGRQLFQGILADGTQRSFTDNRRLRLVLGNAGAVQLTVNGEALGVAGGSGEVVRLDFGRGQRGQDPTAG
ncbi:MAG: helix-turn-helix domain-containing protein [Actinomycetes bacterium]